MVLGYDVHHAGADGGSSVGAMVATMNPTLGRYYSCVEKIQTQRQEVGSVLPGMFRSMLLDYSYRINYAIRITNYIYKRSNILISLLFLPECLDAYKRKNGQLPQRVMMYRDGVGEGQVRDVFTTELNGFKVNQTFNLHSHVILESSCDVM